MKFFYFLAFSLYLTNSFAQNARIIASGDWTDPNIWQNLKVAASSDAVYIAPHIEVKIPKNVHINIPALFNHSHKLTLSSSSSLTCEQIHHLGDTIWVADQAEIIQTYPNSSNTIEGVIVFEKKTLEDEYNVFASPFKSQALNKVSFGRNECRTFIYDALYGNFERDYPLNYTISCDNSSFQVNFPYRHGDGIMNTGFGYFFYPSNSILNFNDSSLQTGSVNCYVYANQNESDQKHTWNLLGNPYPSKIRIDKFLYANRTVLEGTAYTLHNGYITGVYNSLCAIPYEWNNPIPNMEIKPLEGFYCAYKKNINHPKDSAIIGFSNPMRLPTKEAVYFGENTNAIAYVRLTNKHNNRSSVTAIGYIPNETSNKFNSTFDAELIETQNFLLASRLNEQKLHIQGIEKPSPSGLHMPLFNYFDTWYDGVFGLTTTSSFAENIWLIDHLHGDSTLLNDQTYETRIYPSDSNRFSLFIQPKPQQTTHTTNHITPSPFTWYINQNNIRISSDHPITNIAIYNTNGHLVYQSHQANTNQVIDISTLSKGAYITKLLNIKQTHTFKFIK